MKSKNFTKQIVILIMFIMSSAMSFGQNENWTRLKSEQGISVYVQESECDNNEYFIFKVENTSTRQINVDLIISIPNQLAYGSMEFSKTLPAHSETPTNCSEEAVKLPKFNSPGSSLNNIQVTITTN